jgi:hypothetical protein
MNLDHIASRIASKIQPVVKNEGVQSATILFFVILVLAASAISVLGYVLHLEWTGVTERNFWHWLELLVAPVLISGGGFLLYTAWAWSDHRRKETEAHEAEKKAHEAARDADLDRITKGYLDHIEQLLLEAGSHEEMSEIVCAIARARTLNVLEGLDQYRKGSIIRFLYTASLLTQSKSSEQPSSEHLFILLKGANLRDAHLHRADLTYANLSGADLSYADLGGANLRWADLRGADLGNAILSEADLSKAYLGGAKLSKAKLIKADLSGALGVTNEQLQQAASHQGAIMPEWKSLSSDAMHNAQKHEQLLKDKKDKKDQEDQEDKKHKQWLNDKKACEQDGENGALS